MLIPSLINKKKQISLVLLSQRNSQKVLSGQQKGDKRKRKKKKATKKVIKKTVLRDFV